MSDPKISATSPLRVFSFRGQAVALDSDLAELYGVKTRIFNQAIRRNAHRFPSDFVFQLNPQELEILRSQIVISKMGAGGRRYPPWVFTEHGAILAATILNSPRAIAMSAYVVRAFVQMRREMQANTVLEARLERIEKILLTHYVALRELYSKIKPLLLPPPDPPRKELGFHTGFQSKPLTGCSSLEHPVRNNRILKRCERHRRDHDIDYHYQSQNSPVPGSPAPFEDHFHPVEPIEFRLGLEARL